MAGERAGLSKDPSKPGQARLKNVLLSCIVQVPSTSTRTQRSYSRTVQSNPAAICQSQVTSNFRSGPLCATLSAVQCAVYVCMYVCVCVCGCQWHGQNTVRGSQSEKPFECMPAISRRWNVFPWHPLKVFREVSAPVGFVRSAARSSLARSKFFVFLQASHPPSGGKPSVSSV